MTTEFKPPSLAQFQGCLLGLALGDALGAPFEGGALERLVWRLIGRTRTGEMRWTDDTQMSLDLAESLIAKGSLDLDDLAIRFARSYRWSRGYGPGAARLLKRIARGTPWQTASQSIYPGGSYGNGGAMRAAVIGLCYWSDIDRIIQAADDSARITHSHPLGREGAVLIAVATAKALISRDPPEILTGGRQQCRLGRFTERLAQAEAWLQKGTEVSPLEVRSRLGNRITAAESCVTAVYLAARFLVRPFTDLISFVAACQGDVDTIGAMSGAIWGAANGVAALPEASLAKLEDRSRIMELGKQLHEQCLC